MSIVEERYSKWLNHENLAPQYKPVLEAMDAEEKNDAFYTTIEFGTAGMRGLLGPGTNRINIHTIRKATQGYANYINENNGGEAGIAIGYDNRHMTKEDYAKIVDIIKESGIYVVSDEIYAELSFDQPFASLAQFDEIKSQIIVVNGFSKAYAMTGWRLGYCMANKELSSVMNKIHQYVIMSAPVMSQYAGIEAIKNGYDDVLMMKDDYLKRRNFLVNRLNRMGLKTNMPHGTFYVFCNIQSTGLDSETFCEKLLQKQKVACVPGNAFGQSGEGYIRISYAYSIDHIKEAVIRLEQFLKDLDK